MLKRNQLGKQFIELLSKCIRYDRFLKTMDLSNNCIEDFKVLVKYGLKENTSLVNVDIIGNPGCNEKIRKQVALCLLKNLEIVKRSGIEVKDEWIKVENLTFKIPQKILDTLGIVKPPPAGDKSISFSVADSFSRSPPQKVQYSYHNSKTISKKSDSKTRNVTGDKGLRKGGSHANEMIY